MEVTCQLRRDQLTQAGLAQVQVTCCWDGQRTKFGTGQKCLPKHWDTKRERVKLFLYRVVARKGRVIVVE